MFTDQCNRCKHYNGIDTCKAFPDGIPYEILMGDFDHSNRYEDDQGITFEPIEKKAEGGE